MRNRIIKILLLIFYLESLATQPNNVAPFLVGEKLVFDVKWGFIVAGEAVMSIPSYDTIFGKQVYHTNFLVNSTPTFSMFYVVKDRYDSFIDSQEYYSLKFEQVIREGKYKRDFRATFNYKENIAQTNFGDFPITTYVQDVLSAFYFSRTIDYTNYKPGQKIYLNNFYKDKTHPLEVKFIGRETIKVEAGTFRCIVIEPFMKEGALFKSEGRVLVYMSDDEKNTSNGANESFNWFG